ncbi:MAG: DEAD/DEAH box helicase family protein [Hydrogenibacillus schlegelii]|uniref:DEAD/DEAH box helicase family protein n=1 Tax=Hydrogenibacillus schlegelii TaxID=1484 RepID=A0A947CWM5_HYDSH|nr:DEAD/DEAH box helicase family protein [Hydrogenibacillus schlegelii]
MQLSLFPPEASKITLRPYQEEAVAAVEAAYARGIRRPVVAMATGLGKTIVFAEILRRRGDTALVIAHRDELIRQAVEKIATVIPHAEIGVVKGQEDQPDAQIVVASVQSLHPKRLSRWAPGRFATVVIDEAHHAIAPSYRRVVDHLQPDLLLGVTATPFRGDRITLKGIFDDVVYSFGIVDGIRSGYLADIEAYRIETKISLDAVRTAAGDFVERDLARAIDVPDRNKAVVQAYRRHADGRKAIVFAAGVRHAESLVGEFRKDGVRAEAVFGHTPAEERRAVLERFRAGEIPVLVNVAVLTEGFDEPSVEAVILARPTKSLVLYTQMVGRGTRLSPGKDRVILIDVVDATVRHRLITIDELIGVPGRVKSGRRISDVVREEEKERTERYVAAVRMVAPEIESHRVESIFRDLRVPEYDWRDVLDAVETHREDREAYDAGREAFRMQWGDNPDTPLTEKQRAALVAFGWPERHVKKLTRYEASFALDRHLALLEDVRWRRAVAWAEVLGTTPEDVVKKHFGQPWQVKPATEKQRALLKQFRVDVSPAMTAGEASIVIDMLLKKKSGRTAAG